MRRATIPLAFLALCLAGCGASGDEMRPSTTEAGLGDRETVVAIDVALDADSVLAGRTAAVAARLRRSLPVAARAGADAGPRITLLQRYVRETDLDAVSALVEEALEEERAAEQTLRAIAYYAQQTGGETGAAVVVVDLSPALRRLHRRVVDAVQPFAVAAAGAEAFETAEGEGPPRRAVAAYVAQYVPRSSGENYAPHATVGVGRLDVAREVQAQAFEPFAFRPTGASIHRLGGDGTARTRLWSWTPKRGGGGDARPDSPRASTGHAKGWAIRRPVSGPRAAPAR